MKLCWLLVLCWWRIKRWEIVSFVDIFLICKQSVVVEKVSLRKWLKFCQNQRVPVMFARHEQIQPQIQYTPGNGNHRNQFHWACSWWVVRIRKHDFVNKSSAFEAKLYLAMNTLLNDYRNPSFPANTVFFNSTPEFLKLTGFKTILPGKKDCFCIPRFLQYLVRVGGHFEIASYMRSL